MHIAVLVVVVVVVAAAAAVRFLLAGPRPAIENGTVVSRPLLRHDQ